MRVNWGSQEFVEDFRGGDPSTLEVIYWEHVGTIEHVLEHGFVTKDGRRVIGVDDAQQRADLLQEVFLRAFSPSARRSFDPAMDYRPYLLAIGRNVLVDLHRRRGREQAALGALADADLAAVAEEPGEPEWSAPAVVHVVERYVAGLASPLREIHEVRFVRGRSQREAALELGISRQNLRTFEARLKEGLRRALAEAWRLDHAVRVALDARIGAGGGEDGARSAAERGK